MNNDKNNIIYTAKDIEQYLEGKLAPAQMHAMEKAALDDPFLADAIEGFESMKSSEWKVQLLALHEDFTAGRTSAKVIPLSRSTGRWWKAAAAILVIGSGTAMTWLLTRNNETAKGKEIAQNIVSNKDTAAVNTLPGTLSTEPHPLAKADTKLTVTPATGKTNDVVTSSNYTTTVKVDSGLLYTPDKQKSVELAKAEKVNTDDGVEKEKYKANQTTVNSVPPAVVSQSNAVNTNAAGIKNAEPVQSNGWMEELAKKKVAQNTVASNRTAPLNRRFIAQVVGPDNSPLPYANINIRNENFGTYADVKGNFRLVSTDSLLNIEVKSVGYLTRTYTLRSSLPQNKIVLTEDDIAFKEKTVAKDYGGIADKKTLLRRATLLKDSVVNVEPADGWDNYGTYVANNIEIPDNILKKEEHGEVEITFDVKSNGTISNIKVDQSNCDHCAEAAKRVIEQGPQWKVKKGKKASARVKLQF